MKLTLILVALAATISIAFGAAKSKKDRCSGVASSTAEYDPTTHAFKGCRLDEVEENSLYAKLGLKKGDVVQINDEPGPKKAPAVEIYNSALKAEPSRKE